jgi:hypothetical protein
MEAKRLDVKLFATGSSVDPKLLIPVFHGWIQRGAITDELLIDVADYSHVVDGPGVLLVGHEAHYGFAQSKGRSALLYSQRRAPVAGSFAEALRYGLVHALRAASLLQKEEALGGKLAFSGQELLLRINDRLAAPNTKETFAAVQPVAREVLGALLGSGLTLEAAPPSGELFTLHARGTAPASIDALLARLG